MLLSGGVWELLRDPWTARRSNQSILKESVLNIHWKDWCWSSNTLATWCEELTHWKRPWCWARWRQEEKGMTEDEMVGWHHRLTGREFEHALGPGLLQSLLSQRVRHDWVTELNWDINESPIYSLKLQTSSFFWLSKFHPLCESVVLFVNSFINLRSLPVYQELF